MKKSAMAILEEESKLAEQQIEEFAKLSDTPVEETITDETPIEEPAKEELKPAETPADASGEIDKLKAEVTRLQAMLDDENTPTWRQRYDTLNGMQKVLAGQLQDLKAELTEMKAIKAVPVEPPKPSPDILKARERLTEKYSDETVDDIMALTNSENSYLKAEITKLQSLVQTYQSEMGQVKTDQKKTAAQGFISDLTSRVPDWKKLNGWKSEGINADPKFLMFLDKLATGTRYTYRQLIANYQSEGDAEMVSEIFNIFKRDNPAENPKPEAQKDVKKFIEPSKTTTGSPPPPDDKTKKTYPSKIVYGFFQDFEKGRLDGKLTKAEIDQRYDEYTKAISEGRVK